MRAAGRLLYVEMRRIAIASPRPKRNAGSGRLLRTPFYGVKGEMEVTAHHLKQEEFTDQHLSPSRFISSHIELSIPKRT